MLKKAERSRRFRRGNRGEKGQQASGALGERENRHRSNDQQGGSSVKFNEKRFRDVSKRRPTASCHQAHIRDSETLRGDGPWVPSKQCDHQG